MTLGPFEIYIGLPWWLRWYRIYLQCGRPGFNPWIGKIPWRREMLSTPVFLPGEFHRQKSLVGYYPWGHKELDVTERLSLYTLLLRQWKKESQVSKYRSCLVAISCLTLLWPHGLQPTRLLYPQDFPGKNTGMGCHFLLALIICLSSLSTPLKDMSLRKGEVWYYAKVPWTTNHFAEKFLQSYHLHLTHNQPMNSSFH